MKNKLSSIQDSTMVMNEKCMLRVDKNMLTLSKENITPQEKIHACTVFILIIYCYWLLFAVHHLSVFEKLTISNSNLFYS